MKDTNYYLVPRLLDVPPSFAGVALVELIPSVTALLLGLLLGHEAIGLGCTIIIWQLLRKIHIKHGYHIITESLYHYLPYSFSQAFLRFSPPSHFRFWRH